MRLKLVGGVTMWAVAACVILGLVILGIGILLLRGKGAFLISGYNMMSKEEKAAYNEKKLCRATGIVAIIASALVFTIAFCGYRVETNRMAEEDMLIPAVILSIILILAVIGNMIYADKKCRFESDFDRFMEANLVDAEKGSEKENDAVIDVTGSHSEEAELKPN